MPLCFSFCSGWSFGWRFSFRHCSCFCFCLCLSLIISSLVFIFFETALVLSVKQAPALKDSCIHYFLGKFKAHISLLLQKESNSTMLSVVGNRVTQDTSQKSQGNFFCHFYVPFFYIFKTWKIINWDFWEVSWVALFRTTFPLYFLALFFLFL